MSCALKCSEVLNECSEDDKAQTKAQHRQRLVPINSVTEFHRTVARWLGLDSDNSCSLGTVKTGTCQLLSRALWTARAARKLDRPGTDRRGGGVQGGGNASYSDAPMPREEMLLWHRKLRTENSVEMRQQVEIRKRVKSKNIVRRQNHK